MKYLKKITKSWYFPWLVLAVSLRLVVAAVTAHPDLWALFFAQQLFVNEGVLNIYEHLSTLPQSAQLAVNYGTNFFTYPPLAYFIFGFFGLLVKPFLSPDVFSQLVTSYPQIYQNPEIFKTLFLFKLPYLVFDIGIAFLLASLFTDQKRKKLVFLLWLFNPLALYTSFMVGQLGVIPLFFSVLTLVYASKGKNNKAAFSLGVGGALKMFPLFFLPFLVLVLGKTYKEKARLAVLGLLPYFLSILPFLPSGAFRQVSLLSAQSQKMLHMILPVSGAEGVYVFALVFFALVFLAGYKRGPKTLNWYFLGVMLLFFSVTHYHPQWFLWLTPFLIIELVRSRFQYLWLGAIMVFTWLVITLTFEPSLNLALFAPLSPDLARLPGLFENAAFYDIFQLKSLLRSLFAAAALSLVLLTFKQDEKII